MTALLDVSDLEVRVDNAAGRPLVNEVSFRLEAGQVLSLLGESGSGKSLLAQAVMGTLPAGLRAHGSIGLAGSVTPAGRTEARRAAWGRRIALLPQEPWAALDPTMRAQAQVAETHRFVRGLPARDAAAAALQDLARLGLAAAAGHLPHQLSGGMAQRVAFAATTAAGAPVLIVDEPTKGLDVGLRDQVVALLQGVVAGGGALLVITHDVAVARSLGGRVAVMRDAEVVEMGEAEQVLAAPAHAYTQALLAAEPARWPARPPALPRAGAPLLQAHGVTQRFGRHVLFENLDLAIHAGERVALVGPSGSGKTSLGNVLLGLQRPASGRVERLPGGSPHGLQKLYQDPLAAFAPKLLLRQALQDLLRRHHLPPAAVPPLLQRLGLDDALLDRLPSQVSGGELQRIALLRLLLLQPVLVFADEPTSRLDLLTQQQTLALMLSTLEAAGGALLLVTHDPVLADKVAERCIALPGHAGVEPTTRSPLEVQ